METAVATLLLVVVAAVLACSVAAYTVTTVEQTMKTQDVPIVTQMEQSLNQTLTQSLNLNGTTPGIPSSDP